MSNKANKETTVKAADKKAEEAKSEQACREAIVSEAMKLHRKEEFSVQQMMAYCRQLDKCQGQRQGQGKGQSNR